MTNDNISPITLALDDNLDVDAWIDAGRPVVQTHNSSLWWVGDWLLFADRFEGADADRAKKAIVATNVPPATAKVARWVANSFPPDRRRRRLSVWHHVAVGRLDPTEADHMLDDAEHLGLSTRELEQRVRRLTGERETHERPTLLGSPVDVIEGVLADDHDNQPRLVAERIVKALAVAGWSLVFSTKTKAETTDADATADDAQSA